ncbi:hypothetical protein HERIO_2598 [Hepatospora eriocheir]|uniref:Uncharacterized protein n=1 Tax=Hepatospora eriocheir TaxID=1081669 RepID=A0A1X0Q6E4_9MICR|nr:hypothetical protein HERIO_2598 [Hepatospora eriocheir]
MRLLQFFWPPLYIEVFSPEFLFIKGCNNIAAEFLSNFYLFTKEEEKYNSLSTINLSIQVQNDFIIP